MAASGPSSTRNYIAFISYRQVEPDRSIAEALHRALERYQFPRALVKRGLPKRPGIVFLDRHELRAGSLSTNIRLALSRSEFLIVLCSPSTPESEWVAEETRIFLQEKRRQLKRQGSKEKPVDRVLPVRLAGDPLAILPKPLVEELSRESRGKGLDSFAPSLEAPTLRQVRRKLDREVKLQLVAAITPGCEYAELAERDQRRQRRAVFATTAAALLFAIGVGAQQAAIRSPAWQILRVLQTAPVEDVGAATLGNSWGPDEPLYSWLQATLCSDHPDKARQAVEAVTDDHTRLLVATSYACILHSAHSPAEAGAEEMLKTLSSKLPVSDQPGVEGLVRDARDTLVAAGKNLLACGLPRSLADLMLDRVRQPYIQEALSAPKEERASRILDLLELAEAYQGAGKSEAASAILTQAWGLSEGPEIDADTRARVIARRLSLEISQGKINEAENVWNDLRMTAGDFNSTLAFDWDERYRELVRKWLDTGRVRAALESPAGLEKDVEQSTGRLILFSELISKGNVDAAFSAWRGLVDQNPTLDAAYYDLPKGITGWEEPLTKLIGDLRRQQRQARLPEIVKGVKASLKSVKAVALVIAALPEGAPRESLVRRAQEFLPGINSQDRCSASLAIALAVPASPDLLASSLQPYWDRQTGVEAVRAEIECGAEFATALEKRGMLASALPFWRQTFERTRALSEYDEIFPKAIFGYANALVEAGKVRDTLDLVTSVKEPKMRWQAASAVAERLDQRGSSANAARFFDVAVETAQQLTPDAERADALELLARALAWRGDLREARLLCNVCTSKQRASIYAVLLARQAPSTCSSQLKRDSLIEYFLK